MASYGTIGPNTSVLTIAASTAATRVDSVENRTQTGQVVFQAPLDNSGTLYVGASDVTAANKKGLLLRPGDAAGIEGDFYFGSVANNLDLSTVYVTGTAPADTCMVMFFRPGGL